MKPVHFFLQMGGAIPVPLARGSAGAVARVVADFPLAQLGRLAGPWAEAHLAIGAR